MQNSDAVPEIEYVAPAITRLGTLSELTLGGVDGSISDGLGTAGDEASV